MAQSILTSDQASLLYKKGLAILEGMHILTTHEAMYDWNPTTQRYEAIHTGLRVTHHHGARWNGARFIRCHCQQCQRYPEHAALVEIYEGVQP